MKLSKITAFCFLSILGCSLLAGCSHKTKTDNVSTNTDAVSTVETSSDTDGFVKADETVYKDSVSGIKFTDLKSMGVDVTYNDKSLSYPMAVDTFTSDGWKYSDDSFESDDAKSHDYSDFAYYTNDKYAGKLELSGYRASALGSGITGTSDNLSTYGAYIMTFIAENDTFSDESKIPDFKINGVNVLNNTIMNLDKILSDSCSTDGAFVYDEDRQLHVCSYEYTQDGCDGTIEVQFIVNKDDVIIGFCLQSYSDAQATGSDS